MKNKSILVLSVLLSTFWFSSCENNNNLNLLSDEKLISIVETIDSYGTDDVEEATSETKSTENFDNCFEIVYYPNENGENWPKIWSINYVDCEKPNGTIINGTINVTLTDCWRNEGSLRTLVFEEFYINDNHVEGTKTIENTGLNENENPTWEWKIIDGKITNAEGSVSTLNSSRYSELVEGADTWTFSDNVFEVTGQASGTIDGLAYTVEITSPLVYIFKCRFPVSGILTINIEGNEPIIINYGDGECDNIATKQIGEEIEEIVLCKL